MKQNRDRRRVKSESAAWDTKLLLHRWRGKAVIIILMLVIPGCSLFENHPYETMLADEFKNLNHKSIQRITSATPESDTVTLIAIGDSQRFYDELDDFVRSANTHPADFVILNGDISDFGIKDEFEWVHKILKRLNKPYVGVIGNHDLSGNGETIFKAMYGPMNDSFVFNGVKFILLNTNSREYNFNGRVPDVSWLETELHTGEFRQAVVVSHIQPNDSDFDPSLAPTYAKLLRESGKVRLSLHAHRHSFAFGQPYKDGIDYLTGTSMDDRMYLIVKIFGDQYTFEKIYY